MRHERIFVVGHRGILGRDVVRWFTARGHQVVITEARFGALDDDPLLADVIAARCPVVINCAAALPGRSNHDSQWLINALLPIRLALVLEPAHLLVHASTDGVFTGAHPPYDRADRPDARDTYGASKAVGEWAARIDGVVVVRTSILGTGGGLLRWLLDQVGEVEGYDNHRWSGVTTLEWARRCGDIISAPDRHSRIEHLASPPVSKFDLLVAASTAFSVPVRIRRTSAPTSVDRTLVPTIATGSITEQLQELRLWVVG